jgi:hypothetical protein
VATLNDTVHTASEAGHRFDTQVRLAPLTGWEVRTTRDDGVVLVAQCGSWQRVERVLRRAERAGGRVGPLLVHTALVITLMAGATAARAQEAAAGSAALFDEPRALAKALDVGLRTAGHGSTDDEKSGFYPELSVDTTGAGWIAGGPGYRAWLGGDRLLLDGSAAVSWRLYKMAQGRAELTNLLRSRLALGAAARWQDLTQVTTFGAGDSSLETDRSEYRLRSTNVVGYAIVRPARQVAIKTAIGWLEGPAIDRPTGAFRRGFPATQDVLPSDPAFALTTQPDYLHGETSVTADTRDHRGHPSRGGLYRAAWSRYADRAAGTFSFDRYEAEAAQFLPVAGGRVVLAVRGWLVASPDDDTLPLYLMPSLGGANTLRSYADYRFHDRAMAVANAEVRLAIFEHVDAALFGDAGNVAARASALNLDNTSLGVGLRLHTERATIARLDVAHGAEGWRLLVRTNNPLQLSRLGRRAAAAPFVP